MTKLGRPKKYVRFPANLEPYQIRTVENVAGHFGITKQEALRRIVAHGVANVAPANLQDGGYE